MRVCALSARRGDPSGTGRHSLGASDEICGTEIVRHALRPNRSWRDAGLSDAFGLGDARKKRRWRTSIAAISHNPNGECPLPTPKRPAQTCRNSSEETRHVDPGQNAGPSGRGCAERVGGGAFPGRNAILHAGRHGAEGRARGPRSRAQRHQEQRLQVPAGARGGQFGAGGLGQARRPLRPGHRRRLADGNGATREPPPRPPGVSRRALALRRIAPGARRVLRRGEAARRRSAPSVAGGAAAGTRAARRSGRLSRRQPAASRAAAAGRDTPAPACAAGGGTPAGAQRRLLG